MKIRRKLPRPSRSGQPLYIIGYSSEASSLPNLREWFDREYGGPLVLQAGDTRATEADINAALAIHGPWNVWLHISVPLPEAGEWKHRLAWRHDHASAIVGATLMPRSAIDSILHAARLARGLTLLTDGTTYDVTTQAYLNPADWQDRPLDQFRARDHIEVFQTEAADVGHEWFYTRGLTKFGLDDLETFRPVGLPGQEVTETLFDIAEEIVRMGQSPNIGLTLPLHALGLSVRVIRHRTAFHNDAPLVLREIIWST
jgi:hypothetical protein